MGLVSMACEVADGLRLNISSRLVMYVQVSMACEVADGLRQCCADSGRRKCCAVSMACEVADGLRRKLVHRRQRTNVRRFQWPVKWPMVCAHGGKCRD